MTTKQCKGIGLLLLGILFCLVEFGPTHWRLLDFLPLTLCGLALGIVGIIWVWQAR